MRLAVGPEAGEARVREARLAAGGRLGDRERGRATAELTLGEVREGRPAGPGGGGREAAGDDRRVEIDDVDQGPADVGGDGADPHPGQRLAQPGLEGGDDAADRLARRQALGAARPGQLGGELERQTRLDGGRTDREDHGHGMDIEDVGGTDRQVGPAAQAGRRECGVDRPGSQDRRHGEPVERRAGVGQDDDCDAAPGPPRRPRARADRGQSRAGRAIRGVPGGVEDPDPRAILPNGREQPVEVDDDRSIEPDRPRSAGKATEQRRAAPELDPHVHHDPLTFGVDRRVGDLRECLAEMVGDGSVEPTATRCRRVVAHAPERLVALERHRLDVEPGPFGVEAREVAEGVLLGRDRRRRRARPDRRLDPVVVDRARRVVDRERPERTRLCLGVLEDRAAAGFDEQQLARTEPSATDRLGGRERDGTRLRGDRHEPVAGHGEGGRPQPVPVDQDADVPAVGEDDRRRPVPRREEAGRPASERGDVRMRGATQRQRLGDRGQEGRCQLPAGGGQKLERLVERQRIGAVLGQERTGGQQRTGRPRNRRRPPPGHEPARGCRGPC